MHVLGEALDEVLNISGELACLEELFLELIELRLAGELSSEKEPEGSLGKGLRATGGLVSLLSHLIEILATVGNTIEVVKLGGLIEEAWHASHATDYLADCDLTELGVTVLLLEVVEHLLLLMDGVFHLLLKGSREVSLSVLFNIK